MAPWSRKQRLLVKYYVGKGKLAVLGDWQDQPSYAVFDGKGLTLHQWGDDA